MGRLTLLGAGFMMLVVGALHLVAPQMMMQAPHIELTSTNHFHIIRAAYGGAYIGIGVLFLMGLWRAALERFCLIAVATLFCGFAFGRVYSLAVDGVPAALYLAVLAFEATFAVLAISSLRNRLA
jgi:drug/metabolite transporter superfamily protein YnfA